MLKNVAGQKLTVYVFDSTTNLPKTGDAANLTAYRDLDDGGVTVLADTSATEKDATNAKGFYIFDLTQGETNGDKILFTCKSATANMVCLAMPAVVYTVPPNFTALSIATGAVTVGTNNDKTGYGLSSAAVQAIWDALTSALTTVSSIGKLLVDNINAAVSSRLASASYTVPPTVGAIADQVWDEAMADHLGAGSTGASLNGAGSAGDPWTTALPGAYGSGTAGKIVGDNLNAAVSSRSSQTSVDDLPTNAELATALGTADDATLAQIVLVKAKTDLIPASPAAVGSAMTLTSGERDAIAAALLDLANAIETGLTVRQSLRLSSAADAGKISGAATTTVAIRNAVADSKPRITATVDADGNRTAITTDVS